MRRAARKLVGSWKCRALSLPWNGMLAPGEAIELQVLQSLMCDIEFFAAKPEFYPTYEEALPFFHEENKRLKFLPASGR